MKKLMVLLLCASLAACAAPRPLVDTKGVDMNRYTVDLAECQKYASEVPGAGTGAVAGALGGFLLAYGISRASGGYNPAAAGRGTAVAGGALGAAAGVGKEHQVVRNCMAGRGYRVID